MVCAGCGPGCGSDKFKKDVQPCLTSFGDDTAQQVGLNPFERNTENNYSVYYRVYILECLCIECLENARLIGSNEFESSIAMASH